MMMKTFPIAKINLGLNIVSRRPDGYHDLETVFYPVALHDTLEVSVMDVAYERSQKSSSQLPATSYDLTLSGMSIEGGDPSKNLVVKAYELLRQEFPQLPRLNIHLHKAIPTQAGMGGGSSDGAFMLRLLNDEFHLGLSRQQLIDRAVKLGADCPFFIEARPAYAEGVGERLQPIDISLKGMFIALVRPDLPVSTREAFALVRPCRPSVNCRDVVALPVEQWRGLLVNDFETSVFQLHPQLRLVKERLYQLGALYAAMSGSGSTVFGLFRHPVDLSAFQASGVFTACLPL